MNQVSWKNQQKVNLTTKRNNINTMALTTKKTVLITGCSAGGIGWAMAKVFQKRGYHVFATARDPSKAVDLSKLDEVEVLELDVTIPQTIAKCKDIVTKRTGGKLDVLVNNAGVEIQSPLLDVDIAEAKALYDVNVWGPLAVTQAFAPLLIKAKGVVFNQSSIDAVLSMAWAGIFASSKAAEARISETMRIELEPLGVRVLTGMTGSANTPMFSKPGGQMRLAESSYYHSIQETAYKERMEHKESAMEVGVLAEKLVTAIVGGSKGLTWHGALAPSVRYMVWLLPTSTVDGMVNKARGVPQVKRR